MPEVKLNSKSPFHLKFTDPELQAVQISVYIYSGTKDVDKGEPKFQLYKDKIAGTNDVIFEIADLVKDYLSPSIDTPLNSNVDYVKWVQIESQIVSDKPTANDLTVVTEKNTARNIILDGFDIKFRPLTYTLATNPSDGTATISGRVVAYTPDNNYVGSDSFTYTVNNGVQDSDSGTVTVLVKEAGTTWDSGNDVYYSSSSLAAARQNVIDQTNRAIDLAGWTGDNYVHRGFAANTPYSYTDIGLLDIDRQHYQNLSRTIPVLDGYYGIRYWVDSLLGEITTEQQAMIATWEVQSGQVVKSYVYSS